MKPVRCASSVADQVESKFTVSAFHCKINFTRGNIYFSHHNFKMVDQGFHFTVYIFFRWQVNIGDIHMEIACRKIFQRIFDQFQALPQLFLPHAEAVVCITLCANRDCKIKIVISAIGIHYAYIIIHTGCTEVRAGESVIKCPFGRNSANTYGTVHENAVTHQELFKLTEFAGKSFDECPDLLEGCRCKVSFETTDAAQVCRKARTTHFFIDFIDSFPFLEDVGEAGECSAIHANHAVTYQVVGDAGQFHRNDAHVIDPLVAFNAQQLFYRHVPSNIVDGRRTIVHPVGERFNLVKGLMFGNFFKCTVNIAYGLFGINDDLTVHGENILEYAVRSRVCRPEVKRCILLINVFGVYRYVRVVNIHSIAG